MGGGALDVCGSVGLSWGEVAVGRIGFNVLSSLPSVLTEVLFLRLSVASLSFSAVA